MNKLTNFLKDRDIYLIIFLALIFRVCAAILSPGFNHPDEHFHALEPAHGMIYGYWLKTWEWHEGIRSFLLPSIYAIGLKLSDLFGIIRPLDKATFLRILTGIFSSIGVYAVYKIAELFNGKAAARIASIIMAVWWIPVYFGVRTMAEPISMIFILLGHYFALKVILKNNSWKNILFAGLLFGMGFCLRFQAGIFPVAIAAILIWKKEFKHFFIFSVGVLIMVALQGLLDLITWNSFLHSPIQYFISQIIDGMATKTFGKQPWHRYLTWFIRYFTVPLSIFLIFFSIKSFKKLWPLWPSIILFWGMHQLVGHKEDRFLIPLVPLYIITMSSGFWMWHKQSKWPWQKAITILAIISFIGGGIYKYKKHNWSSHFDVVNTYQESYFNQNIKGLLIFGRSMSHTGGYFYIHRNIPIEIVPDIASFDSDILDKIPNEINAIVQLDNVEKILEHLRKRGVTCEINNMPLYICQRTGQEIK